VRRACHAFKAAGSTGTSGPNLDCSTLLSATILARIAGGKGAMQAYAGTLASQQIQDVAQFGFASRAG
jgi:mono/diheme cytochrome c family protein